MVDHKAAADKQIDSMTDKVKEREAAGSGAELGESGCASTINSCSAALECTCIQPNSKSDNS